VIVAGMLLDRYDQVGRPMSMYYVVGVDGDEASVLDVKTGSVWPFKVAELEGFLNQAFHCGKCAFRVAE
jgi:hypothetical protein